MSRTLHWNTYLELFVKGETNKIKSDKDFFSVSVSLRFNFTDWSSAAGEEKRRGEESESERSSEWEQVIEGL